MSVWRMTPTQSRINDMQVAISALIREHEDPEFRQALREADRALDAAFLFADSLAEV